MRIVGVLDLRQGQAVHARGGRRRQYQPVAQVAGRPIASGDAIALAREYVVGLGLTDLYVADLDAIEGGAPQDGIIAELADLGAALWLDGGTTTVAQAEHAVARLRAARVVVGLETLPSFEVLRAVCAAVGPARVAFSLDADGPVPRRRAGIELGVAPGATAADIAVAAAHAGVETMIVLDLARVGMGGGPPLMLVRGVRRAAPALSVFAGGGVRDIHDLTALAAEGCAGALVATALQNGRLRGDGVPAMP